MAVAPKRVFASAGAVLGISYLSVALLDPKNSALWQGYLLGSLLAHATLASAWAALGPADLKLRLPLSLVWVLLLPIAIAINIAMHLGEYAAVFWYGACFFGQWILIQIILLPFVFSQGLSIKHMQNPKCGDGQAEYRLRILDIFVLVTIAAIAAVLGRLFMPENSFGGRTVALFVVVISALVLTVPLLITALLERYAMLGILISLLLIAVGAYFESAMLMSILPQGAQTVLLVIAINVSSAILILAVAIIVRLYGYRLHLRRTGPAS